MNKYIFSALAVSILSGCQTTIEASQYTVLDPEINLNKDTPMVVATFKENDLSSKYYVKQTIEALRERGFTNVYSRRELAKNNVIPFAAAYIQLQEEFDTYTYTSADYGLVDSGNSTTTCTGFGVTATCNTTNQKIYGVTGSSTKTGTLVHHTFALHYYDLASQEKILFSMGSTFDKKCKSDFLYEFLVRETVSRINFERPEDYKYKVKLPEGVKCK